MSPDVARNAINSRGSQKEIINMRPCTPKYLEDAAGSENVSHAKGSGLSLDFASARARSRTLFFLFRTKSGANTGRVWIVWRAARLPWDFKRNPFADTNLNYCCPPSSTVDKLFDLWVTKLCIVYEARRRRRRTIGYHYLRNFRAMQWRLEKTLTHKANARYILSTLLFLRITHIFPRL